MRQDCTKDMDTIWPLTWPKMAEELHIFDPKGDVLLILRRYPEVNTAEYLDEGVPPPVEESAPEPPEPGAPFEEAVPESSELTLVPYDPEKVQSEAELESDSIKPESPTSSTSTASWRTKPVQMRVSSKHLILASSTFATSLGSDRYPEGRTLQTEGRVVVQLLDEDPDAMIILLYIIHGLTRKVPRHVSLDKLAQIAFVVNHRQMQEVVELFSDTWIESLKRNSLPDSYTPEVLSWLFVFWVFREEDGFRNMSRILEREGDDSLEDNVDNGPPIPASIISTIQDRRIDGIECMIEVMHKLITKYSSPEILCEHDNWLACDATLLGSLLKGSAIIGIWPRPKDPYPGIAFKTLADQIRRMQILSACRTRRYIHGPGDCHGIKNSIEASLRSLEDRMCGLELESFSPRTG